MPRLRLRLIVLAGLLVGGVALGWSTGAEGASAQSSRHEMQVTVVDENGRAVADLWVAAHTYGGGPGENEQKLTGAGGRARLHLKEGVYTLLIHTNRYDGCTVFGAENPEGRAQAVLAVQAGGSSEISITVAASDPLPEAKWVPCSFDVPLHAIEGTVLGLRGQPVKALRVTALGEDGGRYDSSRGATSAATGAFRVEVPEGSYYLRLFAEVDGIRCDLGYARAESEHTYFYPHHAPRVVTAGEGIAGMDIRLPGSADELCQPIEGVVTDEAGRGLEAVSVTIEGYGPLEGFQAPSQTTAGGAFRVYGHAGPYRVRIKTAAGNACEVPGSAGTAVVQAATFEVEPQRPPALRIVVSGEPDDEPRYVACTSPAGTVTTTLRPGWNLAGWTEGETPVAALFEAIPQLERALAWDAETQSLREAARDETGLEGMLETLVPGMGLWLVIAGTEEIDWTRPVLKESVIVPLAEGWNLVSWAGGEGFTPEEALALLGEELLVAAGWDAMAGKFHLYHPEAPEGFSTLSALRRGDAVWVNVTAERDWLQPDGFRPTIGYSSDVSAETLAALPDDVAGVVAYFAGRFGLFVPDVRFYVGDIGGGVCGYFAHPVVRVSEPCVRSIAHEYSHALQHHVAPGQRNPAWITEGVANRWSAEYYDAEGDRSYSDHIDRVVLPNSRLTPIQLREMEAGLFIHDYARPNYSVAHLAIDRLVALAGGDFTFEYYSRRGSYETWQEAFEAVFGMSAEDFYASFEAHRAQAAPQLPRITGTVLDDEGHPMAGMRLRAGPLDRQPSAWATAGDDGAFSMQVREGSYRLEIHRPEGGEAGQAGWYADDAGGFTSQRSEATTILVASDDITGITVRVPALTWHRIKGVVRGPAGEPLEGILVDAVPRGEYAAPFAHTDENGEFSMLVLGGTHDLYLYGDTPEGRRTIGWYGRDSGFSPLYEDRRVVDAQGQDATGITVRFPVDPAPPQWQRIEGVVLGPNGEPQEGVSVDAYPVGDTPGLVATTDAEGAFAIWVLPGPFTLHLRADTPDGRRRFGFYGGEEGFVLLEEDAGIIEVGNTDLSGITINLPVSLSPSDRRRVSGVVLSHGGQPWAGVQVEGVGESPLANWSATTGEDGRFEAMVPAGDYQVELMADSCVVGWYEGDQRFGEGRDDAKVLSTEAGDLEDVVLRMPNTCARVQGAVIGPDGEPMEGLRLEGLPQGGSRFWFVETDASGGFETFVNPALHRVRLRWNRCHLDWTPNAQDMPRMEGFYRLLSIPPTGVTGLTFTLDNLPSDICRQLEGSVVGPDGQPVARLQVNASPADNRGFQYSFSRDDGSFSFFVRDGRYTLSIASDRLNTCRVGGLDQDSRRGSDVVAVDGEDLVGIRVVVGGERPDKGLWTECTFAE